MTRRLSQDDDRADADEVMIFSLTGRIDPVAVRNIRDIAARQAFVDAFHAEPKKPVIDFLARFEEQGLRVVVDLPGTANLVVSAPASVWPIVLEAMAQEGLCDKVFVRENGRVTLPRPPHAG